MRGLLESRIRLAEALRFFSIFQHTGEGLSLRKSVKLLKIDHAPSQTKAVVAAFVSFDTSFVSMLLKRSRPAADPPAPVKAVWMTLVKVYWIVNLMTSPDAKTMLIKGSASFAAAPHKRAKDCGGGVVVKRAGRAGTPDAEKTRAGAPAPRYSCSILVNTPTEVGLDQCSTRTSRAVSKIGYALVAVVLKTRSLRSWPRVMGSPMDKDEAMNSNVCVRIGKTCMVGGT